MIFTRYFSFLYYFKIILVNLAKPGSYISAYKILQDFLTVILSILKRDRTVNVILRKFRTIGHVKRERFRPTNVPGRLNERSVKVFDHFRAFHGRF
jgi:hypothetical protein